MHESGENYLETILVLENRNGSVRSIDIANELDYTKPSVSRAMSILRRPEPRWRPLPHFLNVVTHYYELPS